MTAENPRVWPDTEPRLLGVFPLIYVAWSDLELEPEEVHGIREVVGGDALGQALESWLDPDQPPTADELSRMLDLIREAGPDVTAAPEETIRQLEDAVGVRLSAARAVQLAPPYVHRWPTPDPTKASFDVRRLGTLLDGPYEAHREDLRQTLEQFEHVYGDTVAEQRERTLERLKALASVGFGRLAFPDVTSPHPTMGPFLAQFETLATFDLSLWTKVGVQFGLFGGSVYFLGTERHRAHLDDIASAEMLGCFAMSETGHGSNVRALGTTATWDGERKGFVIDTPHEGDRKDYVGNAAQHGRFATVFAQLCVDGQDYGVHALLVRIRSDDGELVDGVRVVDNGKKMGLDGVDNGRITFDALFVEREALLDRFGRVTEDGVYESDIASPSRRFFTMIGTLVGGRVSVANAALSASKVALATAVRYSVRRRQFGGEDGTEVPLATYPSHQRRLMPLLATAVALDLALEDLTRRYEEQALQDVDRRELEADAAGMKAVATWEATHTIQMCREACGGAGYLAVNRFAALKADSDVFSTFEGDNTVLLQLVAKSLLTGFSQQFTDDRVLGLMRFLRDRAESALHRVNPLERRVTSREHLRDADLQCDLLRHRTQDHVMAVAGSMRESLSSGSSSFEAFLGVQNAALTLARRHVEQQILERFVAAEEQEQDAGVRRVLSTLRSLHALHRIESDLGWFLEHGYVAAAQASAIREEVDALCAEVSADALHICEAFRIPKSALSAPIARL